MRRGLPDCKSINWLFYVRPVEIHMAGCQSTGAPGVPEDPPPFLYQPPQLSTPCILLHSTVSLLHSAVSLTFVPPYINPYKALPPDIILHYVVSLTFALFQKYANVLRREGLGFVSGRIWLLFFLSALCPMSNVHSLL